MPDFLRWIIAGVSSVVIAGIVFLMATVGIVVAFVVFLVLFVVLAFAMRRARKNMQQYDVNGSRFVFYTNIPGAAENSDKESQHPDVYELSPDEYTVDVSPENKEKGDPKALGGNVKS